MEINNSIISYARSCFQTFEELPFNELDAAVFSQLAYLFISEEISNTFSDAGMPIANLMRAEEFQEMTKALLTSENLVELIYSVVASPRYRNAKIKYYRNEADNDIALQFAAMTFSFGDDMHIVGFRGTDKSFNGWKENIQLIMKKTAYGQMMATNYLDGVGPRLDGKIFVVGHSKGGNLGVYASAHCKKEIQDRIAGIYDMDGPGFFNKEIQQPGMEAVRDRITAIRPVGSPVGMLLKKPVDPIFILSRDSGIMKHDVANWKVEGNAFVRAETGARTETTIISNINAWAETVSDEELILFADTFFGIIQNTEMKSYDEVIDNPSKAISALIKSLSDTPAEKRKAMINVMLDAFRGIKKNGSEEGTQGDVVDWNAVAQMEDGKEFEQFSQEYDLYLNFK